MKSNKILVAIADYIWLCASVLVAYKLSPSFTEQWFVDGGLNSVIRTDIILVPLFALAGLYLCGLHKGDLIRSYVQLEVRIVTALGGALFAYVVFHAFTKYTLIGRYVMLYTFAVGNVGVFVIRIVYRGIASQYARSLLVVGGEAAFLDIKRAISEERFPYIAVGCVDVDDLDAPGEGISGIVRPRQSVDDIVVDVSGTISADARRRLMTYVAAGINVVDVNVFFEENFNRVYQAHVDERWFWGFDPMHSHRLYLLFKRACDVVISLAGILATLPLWPCIALVIKIQDGGPVLYRQRRIGVYNKEFVIYKFRSMLIDAEKRGAVWASKGDPRVTMFGRFLRKSRIDEVPQFWNILKGDMSFVGPRPERPEMIAQLEESIAFYRYRHLVKPGLTGWAQINFPYGASVEDSRQKLGYDLYYLKHASMWLDIIIIIRTAVAMAKGAR